MKTKLLQAFTAALLLISCPIAIFAQAQAPTLGTTSTFALFTASGDFTNIGDSTYVTGDVGTNSGAFSAFTPGTLVGQMQVVNTASGQAATDAGTAYGDLSATACGTGVIGVTLGNGQVLAPGVYCQGAASTIKGTLTLDGQGDPSALFIIKIGGALATTSYSNVVLENAASLCNVYWQINGQLTLGDSSVFMGTAIVNGAISILKGATLFGRGISIGGAISMHNNLVTVNPIPAAAGTITGTATVSQGQTGLVYSVPAINNVSVYIWTVPAGATITSGAATNSITVSFSASASSGSITVQGSNGCGSLGAVSSGFTVTVGCPVASAAGTITGTTAVCQGQTGLIYSVPVITNATSYLWTVPAGATITSGSTTNSITVDYSNVAASGSITVQGISTCGNGTVSSDFVLTISPSPSAAGTIIGTAVVCQGQTGIIYSVPVITNATSYIWTLPAGATITTGTATNNITIDFSTIAVSGNITVQGSNCGTGTISQNFAVVVNPLPAAAGNISGSTDICQGVTGLIYTVPAISGAITYNWTLPAGATITSGNNTNSITVNYNSGATGGAITVKGSNNCGNGIISPAFTVSIHPLPAAITGSSGAICTGGNMVLGAASVTGDIYSWLPITGLTSAAASNPSASPAATTTYTLTEIVTSTGCQHIDSVTVTVNTGPAISKQPVSKMASDGGSVSFAVSATGSGITYQWRKGNVNLSNGGNIYGANLAVLTINPADISDTASDYNVIVSGECSPLGTSLNAALFVCECNAMGIAPVSSGSTSKSLDIYPNPFTSSVSVTIQDPSKVNKWILKLYTATGAEVMNSLLSEQVTTLETSHLPSGIYFYRVFDNSALVQSGSLVAQ